MKQIMFKSDEVKRLQGTIHRLSEETLKLNMQFRGEAGRWGSIPVGDKIYYAQQLLNQLTDKTEKLENTLRNVIKSTEQLQAENRRVAQQWGESLNSWRGLFGSLGSQGNGGRIPLPIFLKQVVTRLIEQIGLFGSDKLKDDPVVKQLQIQLKQGDLPESKRKEIEQKLSDIFAARNEIAKAQTAYGVYKSFGNQERMEEVHRLAEEARAKLRAFGVNEIHYAPTVDVSQYYKKSAIESCDYDPSYLDRVPLDKGDERYLVLLSLASNKGDSSDWAKAQLLKVHQLVNMIALMKGDHTGSFSGKPMDQVQKFIGMNLESSLRRTLDEVKAELSPDEYYNKALDYYKDKKENNLFFDLYNSSVQPKLDAIDQMIAMGWLKKDSAEYKQLVASAMLDGYTDGDLAADNYMYIRDNTDPGMLAGAGLGLAGKATGKIGSGTGGIFNKLPRSVPSLSLPGYDKLKSVVAESIPSLKNPVTPNGIKVNIGSIESDTKAMPKNDRQIKFNEIMGQGSGSGGQTGKPKDGQDGSTVEAKPGGLVKSGSEGIEQAANNLKWGNPKSTPTYGHTFSEHGAKKKINQLIDRAKGKGHQIGQWLDEKNAAEFLADIAKMGPGVHDVPIPASMKTRGYLPDGTEVIPDMARVIIKENGAIRTAYPYSKAHPSGKGQ